MYIYIYIYIYIYMYMYMCVYIYMYYTLFFRVYQRHVRAVGHIESEGRGREGARVRPPSEEVQSIDA